MKRSAIGVAIAVILAGASAFAQQSSTQPPDRTVYGTSSPTTNPARVSELKKEQTVAAAHSTNRADEKFLKEFSRANASEVIAGKLASERSQNSEVKAFAKHMVDDHSQTIDKVQALASQNNVDVKDTPDVLHKAKSAALDLKEGAAFDVAYMKAQVDDHQKVVTMLQEEIKDGKDASVKQLAAQALPEVQKHLDLARALHAKVETDKHAAKTSRLER